MSSLAVRLASAMVLPILIGCSAPRPWEMVHLDDIPVERIPEIDAIPELKAGAAHTPLGSVEGISCRRSSKGMATWEDSVRRTKFRAMQMGGNAIADLSCEAPKGRSLSTLCYE